MPMHKFFLVVPPGFEKLAEAELAWRGYELSPVSQTKGGIEYELPFDQGLSLNLQSRIGTRVLMRLMEFRCRDFPKLFNKVRDYSWESFIGKKGFHVEVSARRSRLMNKKRIANTVSEAIEKSLKSKSLAEREDGVGIFVRFEDDQAQLSLDTSGLGLFKRGYKTLEALAPIRENLAFGLFFALYKAAGCPPEVSLVDPLCGSGTFLCEAALTTAPVRPREEYGFSPWFQEKLWEPAKLSSPIKYIYGFDRHPDALRLAQENITHATNSKMTNVFLAQKDFLRDDLSQVAEIRSSKEHSGPLLGIANPPYGVRVALPAPPAEFYARLMGAFESLNCDHFGFIVPKTHLKHLPKPSCRLDFSNGGIDVSFFIFSK